jgi:hypothetical protein
MYNNCYILCVLCRLAAGRVGVELNADSASCCVVSAKETTDRTYLRYCPNQGAWIQLHYFAGGR